MAILVGVFFLIERQNGECNVKQFGMYQHSKSVRLQMNKNFGIQYIRSEHSNSNLI